MSSKNVSSGSTSATTNSRRCPACGNNIQPRPERPVMRVAPYRPDTPPATPQRTADDIDWAIVDEIVEEHRRMGIPMTAGQLMEETRRRQDERRVQTILISDEEEEDGDQRERHAPHPPVHNYWQVRSRSPSPDRVFPVRSTPRSPPPPLRIHYSFDRPLTPLTRSPSPPSSPRYSPTSPAYSPNPTRHSSPEPTPSNPSSPRFSPRSPDYSPNPSRCPSPDIIAPISPLPHTPSPEPETSLSRPRRLKRMWKRLTAKYLREPSLHPRPVESSSDSSSDDEDPLPRKRRR